MAAQLDLMGQTEIAHMFNVNRVTVGKWITKGWLPAPDCHLACGKIWRRASIIAWADRTGRAIIHA